MRTWKIAYLSFIVSLVIIVLSLAYPVNSALQKRQDPNMNIEEVIDIDLEKFINNLEALKALNDPIVNAYVSSIENAINVNDYETASKLLEQLQKYLKGKYGDKLFIDDPNLAANISLIMSTENITDTGASIDIIDFIEKYGKLLNETSLIDLAEKFKYNPAELTSEDLRKIYELISYLHGETQGTFEMPEIPENISQSLSGIELPPISEFPALSEAPMPQSPLLAPVATQPIFDAFPYLIAFLIIGALIFISIRYKRQICSALSREFKKVVFKSKDYIDLLLGVRINDPVIQLYRKLLFYLRLYGYKRRYFETLREFSIKIREKELRNIVFMATSSYEERVYGNKSINERKLRELRALISKVVRGI